MEVIINKNEIEGGRTMNKVISYYKDKFINKYQAEKEVFQLTLVAMAMGLILPIVFIALYNWGAR